MIKIENFAQALHITNVYHALIKILYSLMMVNAIIAIRIAAHALELMKINVLDAMMDLF